MIDANSSTPANSTGTFANGWVPGGAGTPDALPEGVAVVSILAVGPERLVTQQVPLPGVPPPPVVVPPDPPDPEPDPIGSAPDMEGRLAALLPPWFGGQTGWLPPVLRIPVAMAAAVGSWLHALVVYARAQTRLATATGIWIDLFAWDYLGYRMRRRPGQPDDAYRRRVKTELLRPRATRPAMSQMLLDLTGKRPRILEPRRPQDTGGIGISESIGIGLAGSIGSIGSRGEVFLDVFRTPDSGIAFAAGIGSSVGGIGVPSRLVITTREQMAGLLTDADIYDAIEATRPVGTRTWVRLH